MLFSQPCAIIPYKADIRETAKLNYGSLRIFIRLKEKKPYNPFTKKSAPRILGALADNVGIVFYSYAMAMNSVSTDPLIAVYPVFAMLGGRIIMKERGGTLQYLLLLGIVAGSVMVIAGTVL